jgi:hypothetical protein
VKIKSLGMGEIDKFGLQLLRQISRKLSNIDLEDKTVKV